MVVFLTRWALLARVPSNGDPPDDEQECDCSYAKLIGGAGNANSNFATVGNQNLLKAFIFPQVMHSPESAYNSTGSQHPVQASWGRYNADTMGGSAKIISIYGHPANTPG